MAGTLAEEYAAMSRPSSRILLLTRLGALVVLLLFAVGRADAEPLRGTFANGSPFSGEYVVTTRRDEDGVLVHLVEIELNTMVDGGPLRYEHAEDDFPLIEVDPSGYILILVRSGGMEGRIGYSYVTVCEHSLVSIGVVQMQLHLGKVASIDVQPNQNLTDVQVNKLIRDGLKFNLSTLGNSRNAYRTAALLLLGRGNFLHGDELLNLTPLQNDKEISSDPVLLAKIEEIRRLNGAGMPLASNYRIIGVDRAYFLDSLSSFDAEKSYLIRGDRVSLVKRSNDRRYWLVDYMSKTGRKTEKWLSCEAIDYCN